MDKFSELKAAAIAATPGPWEWFTSNSMPRLSSTPSGKDGDVLSAFRASDGVPCVSVSQRDMAFIAAANPAAALALLAELEAKDKRIAELSRLLSHNIERAEEAEKRLGTPVRLPARIEPASQANCTAEVILMGKAFGWNNAIDACADAIRAAGFTVEGDE